MKKLESNVAEETPAPVNCIINNNNNNNWKEVQLRISENGEMSITGIDTNLDSSLLEIVNTEPKYKSEVVTMLETTSATSVTKNDDLQMKASEKGKI